MRSLRPKLAAVVVLASVTALLSGCPVGLIEADKPRPGPNDEIRRQLLIGKWYSDLATKDGTRRLELAELRADGTFVFQFRTLAAQKCQPDWYETGLWGMDGDIYFTIVQATGRAGSVEAIDPNDGYYYDAYRVLQLDGSTRRYQSVSTGNAYEAQRVGEDFTLSPCRSS